MAPELGGSQISALLESVPGIARVLRSPVADAIVNMIRAGAGLEPFQRADADELIEYAVRRGLINSVEGEHLTAEIEGIGGRKRSTPAKKKPAKKAKKAKKAAKAKSPHSRPKKTAKSASKALKKKKPKTTSKKKAPKKKPVKKATKRR